MRMYLAAAVAAGAFAMPAYAQQPGNFSGARVEGVIGWDHPSVSGTHADGVTYGAGVGYDLQRGNAVFGVEGEISNSTADQCVNGVAITGDQLCASAGRDLYAGGRIGAVVAPRVLVYGKAGYTNGRVRLDYDDGTAATAADFSTHENLDGVRLGGGIEYALSPNSYVKTEYRYSNYEQGADRHQVLAGFGFRF